MMVGVVGGGLRVEEDCLSARNFEEGAGQSILAIK